MCLKLPPPLCPKVCCWLYGVQLGCELCWFWGTKFSLCDGWVGLGQSFGGLSWFEELGPTDNSAMNTITLIYWERDVGLNDNNLLTVIAFDLGDYSTVVQHTRLLRHRLRLRHSSLLFLRRQRPT